jgi:hypothetical protein
MLNCSPATRPFKNMGGVKKKSLASMEKSQDTQQAGQEEAGPSKGKKSKEQQEKVESRHRA